MQREKVKGMTWIEQRKLWKKQTHVWKRMYKHQRNKNVLILHDFHMSGNICYPFPLGIYFFSLLLVSDLPNSYVHLSHPCSCTFMPGVQELFLFLFFPLIHNILYTTNTFWYTKHIFWFWRYAPSTDLNIHIYKHGNITIVHSGNMTSMNEHNQLSRNHYKSYDHKYTVHTPHDRSNMRKLIPIY